MARPKANPENQATEDVVIEKKDPGFIVCEEWKGEFDNGEFKPYRKLRDNVKLKQEHIDELNSACNPHNPIKYIAK
jgi:hypothetical protein